MKKNIPLLSALTLALLLTACGGPVAGTPVPTPAETPEETPLHTPTETLTPAPTETPAGSPVYTDWSKLESYEPKKAVYTRRNEGFTDALIPADDYGPLIPFAGATLTSVYDWGGSPLYYETYEMYGLVTLTGEVALDPVLISAYYLTEWDGHGNIVSNPNVLMLGKVFYDEEGRPEERFALCAGDGSWCTDFLYEYDEILAENVTFSQGIPVLQRGREKLVFLDPGTGEELRTMDLAAQAPGGEVDVNSLAVDPATGWTSVNLYTWNEEWEYEGVPLLFDPQGNFHPIPPEVEWAGRYGDGLVLAGVKEEGEDFRYTYGYVDAATGEWAIEPTLKDARPFENGVAPVKDGGRIYFINTAGEPITNDCGAMPERYGDYWYVMGFIMGNYDGVQAILDQNANFVTDSPLLSAYNCHFLEDGWICGNDGESWVLARGEENHRFPLTLGDFYEYRENRMLFTNGEEKILTDLEGNVIARWEHCGADLTWDDLTGKACVVVYPYYEDGDWEDYYDLDGNLLSAGFRDYVILRGGLFYTEERGDIFDWTASCVSLTTPDGEVVFRWPVHSAID